MLQKDFKNKINYFNPFMKTDLAIHCTHIQFFLTCKKEYAINAKYHWEVNIVTREEIKDVWPDS